MQILIGCAKIMKGTAPEGQHLPDLYTEPVFQRQANHQVQQLVRYDAEELQQMLHINKALATENQSKFYNLKTSAMELTINNQQSKINLTYELTRRKLGMRIWGDRASFYELHELLSECWDSSEDGMSPEEQCSYIGIISYFSYSVRHAFMGDRLVKLDGKPFKKGWDDEMFRIFEKEQDRFEVGLEISWPQMLFIMAAWWECLRHQDCPIRIVPIMREFTENIERLLQQRSKAQYAKIEPYIHGAIYAANPYMMHTMEHINVEYLHYARYGMSSVKDLAEKMECSVFGNWQYDRYLSWLKKEAKKQGCGVEKLREQVDESVSSCNFQNDKDL